MVILIIFAVLCVVGLGIGLGILTNANLEKRLMNQSLFIRKRRNAIIISLISFSLLLASAFTVFNGTKQPIRGAEIVAQVHSKGTFVPLWYDSKTDEYFVSEINEWNILDIAERRFIDKENAKKYIELYEEIGKIDMKGKEK